MQRTIIKIDEQKCTGCGDCIPNCHEGALQIIDGKARLISDLFCDGLGACIGHCPEGAITLEEREADGYNETLVMATIVPKGRNTIIAHLEHLRDHNETELLREAVAYIKANNINMSESGQSPVHMHEHESYRNMQEVFNETKSADSGCGGGCPGSKAIDFKIDMEKVNQVAVSEVIAGAASAPAPSELRQWPVQLHLLNPQASYFINADVVLAADCAAFAMGDFHDKFLKGKTLAIACPKLDSNKESYVEKLTCMIADSKINTLTVVMMEVPCCGGLLQMAKMAINSAGRNIPIKKAIIGVKGNVLLEELA
jgi:MinD superfamily P-loop ATPase containing an inserted ferredoxin domain